VRSYHIDKGAGLAGLTLREHPEPRPGPRQVLVRVRAVSLNARELMILFQGRYPLPVKPDVVAACDGAGEVVAVGPGVGHTAPGDRVTASIFPRWQAGPFRMETADQLGGSLDGMLTELALLDEDALVPVPGHLSFEEAAALPCAGVTAWNALTGGRPLQAGETVLTLGSGGVSLFAIQLARAAGAHVVATTSSPEKAARLRALGAHQVVDYRATPEWSREVRRLTAGRGADHVVEVGGPGTLEESLRSLAVGGEVACVGALASGPAATDLGGLMRAVGSMRRIAVGSRAQFLELTRAVALHGLRPVIGRVFPFEEASAAFAHYAAGGTLGKVIIAIA
jgi:NADPH:quinone reductase-like Zn-dependent oxidoreductase